MRKFKHARLGVIAAVMSISAVSPFISAVAYADTPASDSKAHADVLRSEISKPLVAAKALFDANKIAEALAKIAETDAVTNKTPYEIYAVERTRGGYYLKAGDKVKSAQSFEAAIATNYLPKADQLNLMQIIGQFYFETANYPAAILWETRYLAEGGADPRAKDLLNKSYYLNKDYAQAYKGFNAYLQEEFAAGRVPDEQHLQLLLSCASQMNDKEATLNAAVQFVTYYPAVKQWNYLISHIRSNPGFSDKLDLDWYRLKQELSLIQTAPDYIYMSELATRAGLPAEAKKALEEGFAAGLLDTGSDAKKNAAMLESAKKRAAEDLKTMQQGEASAAKSKDGAALVNLGMAYATAGQYDKGASLIEQGISKGGFARLEEAKLHLGLVYYWAGKKEDAVKQLKKVEASDGTAEIAQYWIMQINHPLPK